MAFGRLDVYWLDGPIEIYQLEKPAISIGRQRGNDIVLDIEAVSRYHATITYKDKQCHIEDLKSVNGTYVDGVLLKAGEPHPLRGGEELQIGDMRAIYHPTTDTVATTSIAEITQVREIAQPYFKISLEGAQQSVSPGMHVRSQLLIENLGDEPDRYFVEVDGVPKEWLHIDRTDLELEPGLGGRVILGVKPSRHPESEAGAYVIKVHVRAGSRPAEPISAEINLLVKSYKAFGIQLERGLLEAGKAFSVRLHNQGNSPLKVSLGGRTPDELLRFNFQPQSLTLQAGQRVKVLATATAQGIPPLRAETHPFAIVVQSHDAAGWQAALPGQIYAPALSFGRYLPLVAGALAALAVGVLLLLALIMRPTPPEITAPLSAGNNPANALHAGDALLLQWEAQNAAQLTIEVSRDGQTIESIPLSPDAQQYIYTLPEAGAYQFTLKASADGADAQSELALDVLPPLPVVTHFALEPPTLMKGLQETLTIWWETQHASGVQIEGLDAILCESKGQIFSPQGHRSFKVCPDTGGEALVLSLIALGEGGQSQPAPESSLTVPVGLVMCRILGEVTLHLPGAESAPLTLDPGTMVNIRGADLSGAWTLVTTQAGNTGWLPRDEALDCGDIAPLLNLIVDETVATPAPSPAQTTPTPRP